MIRGLHFIWNRWSEFWFRPLREGELSALGFTRIFVSLSLILQSWDRQFVLQEFFSDTGFIEKSKALVLFSESIRPSWVLSFWSDFSLPWVHGLYVLGLVALLLGLLPRPLGFGIWFLGLAFVQRNYAVLSGADVIGSVFLFYLCFTPCSESWSLLPAWRRRFCKTENSSPQAPSLVFHGFFLDRVGLRFLQIQLGLIYTFSGFEKLKGSSWWDGTAFWGVLSNSQMAAFNLEFLKWVPELVVLITWGTLCFEIFFIPLILNSRTRIWALVIGFGFHIGIAVFMGLWSFALIMLAPYFLFMSEADGRFLKSKSRI
ncbi:MAG: HTTM domain-containing protein [Bdellovibrio sp.]